MKIWLDTNFLIYAADKKIDYFEEVDNLVKQGHNFIILSSVIKELERLKKGNSKPASSSRLALKILDKNKENITRIQTDELPDKFIIENIQPEDLLASMDRELKRKIKNKSISISKNKKIKIS